MILTIKVVSFNVALYYNTIIAWCLYYLFQVKTVTSISMFRGYKPLKPILLFRVSNILYLGPSVPKITLKMDLM